MTKINGVIHSDGTTHEEFLAQEGGVVYIDYKGSTLGAPKAHLDNALGNLRAASVKHRARIMRSVNKALDENFDRVAAGAASVEEAMNLAQDVVIWYANEIVEGRVVLSSQTKH